MDTSIEKEYVECCGTCHYWQEEENRHSCMNLESIFAADYTEEEDSCNRYVPKRKR